MANKQEYKGNAYLEFKRTSRFGNKRREIEKLTSEIVNGRSQLPNTSNRKVSKDRVETESSPCSPSELSNEENHVESDITYQSDNSSESSSVLDHDIASTDIAYKFKCELRNWAISEQVTQKQLRALLSVCNNTLPFSLPMDPSTLLKTPKPIITVLGDDGKYWHNGVAIGLQAILKSALYIPSKISLNISVDGFPIAKSSNAQFWPILANIHELNKDIEPFVIGVFYGKSMVHNSN